MRCMMAMAVVTALVLTGGSTGSAAAGDKKGSIQGHWNAIKKTIDGKEQPLPEGKKVTFTFSADGKITANENGMIDEGTYKVDDSKKPRQLDLTMKYGDKTEKAAAIYEITGDILKVAFASAKGKEASRPAAFDADGLLILTFKRASK
jgi:uncharacterized protein (TIGR03067 family)